MKRYGMLPLLVSCLALAELAYAQTSTATASALPRLVRFGGTVKGPDGSPLAGVAGITFALYSEQCGGAPLWLETQYVTADINGRYTALLGATKPDGLPAELFTSEQARWVGVQVQGQPEQPRVLLVSAPYALKAGDAETIGGLPPSAFMMAPPSGGSAAPGSTASPASAAPSTASAADTPAVTGSGKADYIPLWSTATKLGSSALFQSGTGATAEVGINTATPSSTLDVNGTTTLGGATTLPATGTATASAGNTSEPLILAASVFNSGTSTAVPQTFQLQAEPLGNDTATASGALSLLYGSGASTPAETGLKIASNGRINFAAGQAFPGVAQLNAANVFTANQAVNGNVSASGQFVSTAATGTAPLQVASTTQVANLNASLLGGLAASSFQPAGSYATLGANTFSGNQSVSGNVAASGSVTAGAGSTLAGLTVPAMAVATASQGWLSHSLNLTASSYDSATSAAVNQTFRWQAEPLGNDTANPGASLNLLFYSGTSSPAQTGLSVASNGQITFATGQTFPGTGSGTVTSVGSGAGLTGGPITSSGSLSIATGGVTNAMLANSSLTVTAGTDLTGGGAVALGNSTTLNLDTTKVPTLAASSNTFTGSQTVDGSVNMVGDTRVDYNSLNAGSYTPGVRFGSGNPGEGISSDRTGTANPKGIDLYTDYKPRFSVTNGGSVGIGTTAPGYTLDVRGSGSFASSTANGVAGATSAVGSSGVYGTNTATSGASVGVLGATTSPSGYGVQGVDFSSGGYGVYGQTYGTADDSTGVYGTATVSNGQGHTYGVWGTSVTLANYGAGVAGTGLVISGKGDEFGGGAGVWGDAGGPFNNLSGITGTADDNYAVFAANATGSDTNTPTLLASNDSTTSGALVFLAEQGNLGGGYCSIDVNGDLNCSGTVSPSAETSEGRDVKLYGVASPENWFEDFGSGQLSGGSAQIALDPAFASTVNTGEAYHVFLTPRGDCEGLYVGATTAAGFEVRELHHGTSNISFDYRIGAKRRGYESVRLEDITDRMNKMRQHDAEMLARHAGRKISVPPVPATPEFAAGAAPAPR